MRAVRYEFPMQRLQDLARRVLPELKVSHIREMFWVVMGQAGAFFASLVTLKILTSALPPAVYGQFNLILIGTILPSWLLLSPLTQALLRYYSPQKEIGALGALLQTTILVHGCMTLIASAVASVLVIYVVPAPFGLDRTSTFLAIGIFFVEAWISLALCVANAARRRGVVAVANTAAPWMRLVFMALGIHFFDVTLSVVLLGYLAGTVGATLYPLALVFREWRAEERRDFNSDLLRQMLAYGLPFGAWSVFAWGQQYADRYVVEFRLGSESAGAYIATLQVASLPFTLLGGLLTQFLTPIIYQRAGGASDPKRLALARSVLLRIMAAFSLFGLVMAALLGIGGSWLMQQMTHEAYAVASEVVFVMFSLGALFSALGQQLTLIVLAQYRSRAVLITKLVPGIAGTAIVWMLTAAFGLPGAAGGFMLTMLLFLGTVAIAATGVPGVPGFRSYK